MSIRERGLITTCGLLFACAALTAQVPSSAPANPPAATEPTASAANKSPSNSVPVFRAATRLVVVDVVVTDKHGQAVTDLKQDDFALTEDGKPQPIKFFEPHMPAAPTKSQPKIDLPPNQYTNFPLQKPASSVNVVLFDILNTPVSDQMHARWQMIQFIKALPLGRPVALFTLGRSLKMIAGFSTSSDELVAAAQKVRPAVNQVDEAPTIAQQASPSESGPGFAPSAAMSDELKRFYFQETSFITGDRVQGTLDAFRQLANALSGYPGRKNLLWLSEGFPITLNPDVLDGYRLGNMRGYSEVLKQSSAILSSAQISVIRLMCAA